MTPLNRDLIQILGNYNYQYADRIASRVEQYYNTSYRYYHNTDHINYMMEQALKFKYPDVSLLYAILYHDAIYDIKNQPGQNEQFSANVFVQDYFGNRETEESSKKDLPYLNAAVVKDVYNAILETANHITRPEYNFDGYNTTGKLMDLDLSSLGDNFENFSKRNWAVISEYSIAYPKEVVIKNNIEFMEKLLQKTRIFYLKPFTSLYEDKARSNLEKMIQLNKEDNE